VPTFEEAKTLKSRSVLVLTPHWQLRAFCAGSNPEIFEDPEQAETALAYCVRCPVRGDCLEFALSFAEVFGVWGGTTDDERRALKRGGIRRSCPGCGGRGIYSDGCCEICTACGLSWLI
jgi:WhiB family redox-sensing transcriptional regulator